MTSGVQLDLPCGACHGRTVARSTVRHFYCRVTGTTLPRSWRRCVSCGVTSVFVRRRGVWLYCYVARRFPPDLTCPACKRPRKAAVRLCGACRKQLDRTGSTVRTTRRK